jgi:hypothetical protein
MLVEREKMTPDQAAAYIKKIDAKRSAWNQMLYGVDWLDPSLYDLVVNLETMNIEGCVEVAAAAVKRREFMATNQSRKAMDDLCLITKVKAALAADPATASAEVEVEADSVSGIISLQGKVRPVSMVDAIVEIAGKVAGVHKVDRDRLGAPDYTVWKSADFLWDSSGNGRRISKGLGVTGARSAGFLVPAALVFISKAKNRIGLTRTAPVGRPFQNGLFKFPVCKSCRFAF